jgi:hypothetical protein
METVRSGQPPSGWLDSPSRLRLGRRIEHALRAARRDGRRRLLSFSVEIDGASDPTAVVVASRRHDEPWFCFEQPDHGGAAVAALGTVYELTAAGPGRFAQISAAWQRVAATALVDPPPAVSGSGLRRRAEARLAGEAFRRHR